MAVTARAVSATGRALPAIEAPAVHPEDGAGARPRLDVVDRRASAPRSVHRQVMVLRTLGVLFVVGALAVTAAAHTFVAFDQQRVDALQLELTRTVAQQQNLQISRAELESPVRVLSIAEHQLGMVAPGAVSYLAPVNPGLSVVQAGSAAKTAAGQQAGQASRSARSSRGANAVHGSKTGLGATRGSTGGRSSAISPPG
ncbi:MAG: hypothetical protein ABSD85_00265 [Acidimicrobiales bacterium]|jgi:cell division protein FtsL